MRQAKTFGRRTETAEKQATSAPRLPLWGRIVVAALLLAIAATTVKIITNPTEPAGPVRQEMFVTSERAVRHTCASATCGDVGELFYRERVEVFETVDGWVRVSQPYDAACFNGRSEYVDALNDQCTTSNGIVDGKFAEWIAAAELSTEKPEDLSAGKSGIAAAMAHSDDYLTHGVKFEAAAAKLMQSGLCTDEELAASYGFSASTNYPGRPVYFVFCGEGRRWIDLSTMAIVKSD